MALSAFGHALIIALLVLLWQPQVQEIAAPPIPVTVVQEKTGRSGAMGGGSDTSAASGASASASEASTTPPEPATETTPEARPEQPKQETETPPPPPSTMPSLAQQSVNAAPAPQEIETVPVRKPAPPRPKPPTPTVAARTPPAPVAPPVTQRQPTPAETASNEAASAAPSNSALPEGAGGRGRGEEGAGRAAIGNGSLEGPGDDYLEAVRRWVTKFRKYPDEAVKQKQEGTVMLGFKFTRDGTVLDAWVERSSGFPLLDQAALQMIRDASPIPKVPDRYKGDTLTLVMPENFRIGLLDRLFQ